MVDKKITELTELTIPASADVVAIVDDPAGTPVTKKITYANLESNLSLTASQVSDFDTEVSNNSSVVANTAKVTNATHTGDVTGATALTIGVDKVNDTHIDFGTGANQVSTADVPEQTNLYYTEVRVSANTDVTANTAKNTNVSTNLSEGTNTTTTVDVNSSDGTNATLVSASTTRAGLLTKAKWDEIVVNNAKVTNVSTNLSEGTLTATTVGVNSSDGTNATLGEADTTNAGILGSDKWDEIVAATAHVADNTQAHSDYLLNSGQDVAVGPLTTTADNSTADTEYIPNVLYNTDATPPTASTVPIGTIYVQYTA